MSTLTANVYHTAEKAKHDKASNEALFKLLNLCEGAGLNRQEVIKLVVGISHNDSWSLYHLIKANEDKESGAEIFQEASA